MSRLPVLLLLVHAVSLAWPASCQPLPMAVPVAKDTATSLYTIPFYNRVNLVVDIAGPLVWSTCQQGQTAAFPCKSGICGSANTYPVPGCRVEGCKGDACVAYPFNPVTGACAAGSLVQTMLFGSTTDGRNPVGQVSVNAVSACAPNLLLASLPRLAMGVVGLSGSDTALPTQVALEHQVAKKFLLCLPETDSYSNGVAIFGGGPLYLLEGQPELTQSLEYTPLVRKNGSPAYYVTAKYIALDSSRVPVPADALVAGGVALRTTVPYTALRADVYRPFLAAFRKAISVHWAYQQKPREVKPVAPFGLCYDAGTLVSHRQGYIVPSVTLAMDGGKNWTMAGTNSMVDVVPGTACLAFVEMKGVKAGEPAVILGGFQMENLVLQFDLEEQRLGFFSLPFYTRCSQFNFTMPA